MKNKKVLEQKTDSSSKILLLSVAIGLTGFIAYQWSQDEADTQLEAHNSNAIDSAFSLLTLFAGTLMAMRDARLTVPALAIAAHQFPLVEGGLKSKIKQNFEHLSKKVNQSFDHNKGKVKQMYQHQKKYDNINGWLGGASDKIDRMAPQWLRSILSGSRVTTTTDGSSVGIQGNIGPSPSYTIYESGSKAIKQIKSEWDHPSDDDRDVAIDLSLLELDIPKFNEQPSPAEEKKKSQLKSSGFVSDSSSVNLSEDENKSQQKSSGFVSDSSSVNLFPTKTPPTVILADKRDKYEKDQQIILSGSKEGMFTAAELGVPQSIQKPVKLLSISDEYHSRLTQEGQEEVSRRAKVVCAATGTAVKVTSSNLFSGAVATIAAVKVSPATAPAAYIAASVVADKTTNEMGDCAQSLCQKALKSAGEFYDGEMARMKEMIENRQQDANLLEEDSERKMKMKA